MMKFNTARGELGPLGYLTCVLVTVFALNLPSSTVDAGLNVKNFNVVKKPIFTGDEPAEFTPLQTLFLGIVAFSLVAGKFLGYLPLNVNRLYAKYGHLGPAVLTRIVGPAAGQGRVTGSPEMTTVASLVNATTNVTGSNEQMSESRSFVLDYGYGDVLTYAKVSSITVRGGLTLIARTQE
jgi:hypothetical protein